MAKMYLLGSDVELEATKRLSRLLGIAHETYECYCICELNNSNYEDRVTKYCFGIIENNSEYCLEIDTNQVEYSSLPVVHINRLVDRATMETNGWFQS